MMINRQRLIIVMFVMMAGVAFGCPDDPPVAIIKPLDTVLYCVEATITFDGRSSYDPDDIPAGESPSEHPGAGIESYSWDFGDGGTASGSSPSHTYDTAKRYTVKLTVTDDEGDKASTT